MIKGYHFVKTPLSVRLFSAAAFLLPPSLPSPLPPPLPSYWPACSLPLPCHSRCHLAHSIACTFPISVGWCTPPAWRTKTVPAPGRATGRCLPPWPLAEALLAPPQRWVGACPVPGSRRFGSTPGRTPCAACQASASSVCWSFLGLHALSRGGVQIRGGARSLSVRGTEARVGHFWAFTSSTGLLRRSAGVRALVIFGPSPLFRPRRLALRAVG